MSPPARGGYPGRGLHGETVETIGRRIISGQYQPGHLLYADGLERELGVSKTVVREALKVLAAKGLVDSRPKRGTVVRPRSAWSLLDPDLLHWLGRGDLDNRFLHDLTEVRFIVEPEGARLAAQRRTDGDLEELEHAVGTMAAAGSDGAAVIEADLAFHRSLLSAAHNELLSRMEVVIEAGLRVRDQLVHGAGPWPDSVPDHQAVLDAVRAQDAAGAAAATRALVAQSSADLDRLVSLDGTPGPGRAGPGRRRRRPGQAAVAAK